MDIAIASPEAAARRVKPYQYPLAVLMAAAGGVLGIIGALFQESLAFTPLTFLIAAPIIEEIAKPAGVYLAAWRWKAILDRRLFIAGIAAIGGIVFGLIESWFYVTFYAPDLGRSFFIYRFTVNVLLHAAFSFVFGLGITHGLFNWAAGLGPLPKASRNAFAGAMTLHALYNGAAVLLVSAGVINFD